jgi:hypothetical protein
MPKIGKRLKGHEMNRISVNGACPNLVAGRWYKLRSTRSNGFDYTEETSEKISRSGH